MKKFLAAISVFAIAMMITTPVSAANTVVRTSGVSAQAAWTSQTGNIVTDTFIDAVKTKVGTDVYVTVCTYNVHNDDSYECKNGYTIAPSNALSVNKLNTATLSAVSVDLYEYDYDNYEANFVNTVTVSASWTGYGQVQKGSYRYRSSFDGYTFSYSSSTAYRSATATGTINGSNLGSAVYGEILQFKSMDSSRVY
jgi:hypothetical protein